MDPKNIRNQHHISKRHHRARTNKLLDRLTYSPNKHMAKKTKDLRKKLQAKTLPVSLPITPLKSLKFGSFNVNGLDIESSWAVEQLLNRRGYDVSVYCVHCTLNYMFLPRSLP